MFWNAYSRHSHTLLTTSFLCFPTVMSGFTTGAAMSIGLSQVKNAFGFQAQSTIPQQGEIECPYCSWSLVHHLALIHCSSPCIWVTSTHLIDSISIHSVPPHFTLSYSSFLLFYSSSLRHFNFIHLSNCPSVCPYCRILYVIVVLTICRWIVLPVKLACLWVRHIEHILSLYSRLQCIHCSDYLPSLLHCRNARIWK